MIGHTFLAELVAKEALTGLTLRGPGISWQTDSPIADLDPLPAGMSPAQVAAIQQVVAAHRYTMPALYRQLRASAYPPIGDQLDDLFRAGAFSAEMAAQLQAVKTKYPKP